MECGQVIGEDYIELLNGIRLIYRCFSKIYADKRAMYNQIEKQLVKCHKCKEIQRRVNDLKETKRDGMVCNRCDKEGKSDEMERREYLEYNNIDPGMED